MQLTLRPVSALAAGLALMISGAVNAQSAFSTAPGGVEATVKPINTGGERGCGAVTLTQSTSQAITPTNSVSCNNGAGGGFLHTDNGYSRAFDLSAFPGGFDVCAVEFGIETAAGAAGTQPVTVNIYSNTGGAYPLGTQTLVATQDITLADQTATIFNQALAASIPAGTEQLVFEVFTPDGQTAGHQFFMGSNAGGQTGSSFIEAADCGITTPTTTDAIGFPQVQFVMNVIGDGGAGVPTLDLGMVTDMDMCAAIPANNNGIIEPGETVNFTIPVQASGGDFTNVVGTLTSATAGVTVVTGMGTYGNITDGNSASANYSITVAETVACDSIIDLNLAVTSTEDNFAFPISRNVGQSATFTYNNLPLAIPDNTPAGASSTANVSGVPGAITNVQVQINTTHTWVGDLIYTLTSPGGTTVTLLDRPNVPLGTFGCSNNDVNVLFADGQPDPESVCSGAPPQGNDADPWPVTDASPVPGDAMADFNGEDANGTWTLTISDNGGGDTGTLVDWELIITPVATGTCEVCPANADVSIVKTAAAPNPLTVGDTITYTLSASNAGPGPASNVVVTDPLPANVTYVSNTCGAAFAAQTVTWTIGNLASGANASCDIVVTVNAVGPINNTATISADQTDPTPANNASTAALAGAFLADVSILKSNTANAGLAPGDAFSFILTVTNNGPTGASNIVVTDVLSDKVSYVSNNCAAVFAGNTLTWTIPALANGAEATCQIDVIFVGLGDVTNTATATAVEPDPDLSNNTATDVATVAAQPIPALNGFTLAALAALMAGLGLWMRRRYVKS